MKTTATPTNSPSSTLDDSPWLGEALYRAIFESSAIGIGQVDCHSGQLLRANPKYCKILGYSMDELLGMNFAELTHPDDRAHNLDLHEKLLSGQITEYTLEKRYLRKGGRYIWVKLDASLLRDQQDVPISVIGIIQDITERKLAEQALSDSHAFYQSVIDAIPDLVVLKDTELRYHTVNSAFLQFIGLPFDAVIGSNDYDLFPKAEADQYRSDDRQVISTGQPLTRTEHVTGASGPQWLQVAKVPLMNAEGDVRGVLMSVRDITELKQAKESVQLHADRYATLLETSHDGFWVIDTDGKLREVNDAYCRLSGYSQDELLGMSIPDLEANESPEDTARHVQEVVQNGFERFETSHRRKDGSVVDVEISTSFWPVTGQFLAFVQDISERLQAREAVNAERQRFNDILDTLPVYLVLLTPDYGVAFANRFFRERFGDPQDQRCFEHLFGRKEPCDGCKTFECLKDTQPREWEWTGPDERQYYVYDFPFTSTDGSTLILEAGLDITDLKNAEAAVRQLNSTLERRVHERTLELEAANRELQAFSYSVSHDLQGPLRAINGFSGALREDFGEALDDTGRNYLDRIQSATLRMSKLIDGLLVLSRVFRSDLNPLEVDLSALAHEVGLQMRDGEPTRTITILIEPGLTATGDATLLRLLLQNLFANAWKFTKDRADACIWMSRHGADGEKEFVIRDNGVGFEMAYAGKLFQPFERLHQQEEFEGTGIGLATVRRIVERHGGTVWAEGAPNQGAAFFFSLPAPSSHVTN